MCLLFLLSVLKGYATSWKPSADIKKVQNPTDNSAPEQDSLSKKKLYKHVNQPFS